MGGSAEGVLGGLPKEKVTSAGRVDLVAERCDPKKDIHQPERMTAKKFSRIIFTDVPTRQTPYCFTAAVRWQTLNSQAVLAHP